ncbi:spore germination protein [Paenibacillus albicereus]|uniref:Spore germination protein n=1 Tax=Paenibacillus albicereus TaxID=2726185 RepID=A0A6H2H3M6_9BACL|nr:spore germination protein [Paenibacillus albicereus]
MLLEASAEPGRLPEDGSRPAEADLAEALLSDDGGDEAEPEHRRRRERSGEEEDAWEAALLDGPEEAGRAEATRSGGREERERTADAEQRGRERDGKDRKREGKDRERDGGAEPELRGDAAERESGRGTEQRSGRGGDGRDGRAAGYERGSRQEGQRDGGRGAEEGREAGGSPEGGNSAPGTDGDALEPIPERIEAFVDRLKDEVGYKTSFDVIVREMTLGGKKTAFFMLNGLSSGVIMTEILQRLTFLQTDSLSADALHSFMKLYVPAVQVEQEDDWNMMLTAVLSGSTGMYIDGESTMLILDAKSFPIRNPEEPSLERVVRGSRDGFVETLLMNVSLVRRRLRDPMLRYEILRVGERTRSDVCIAYIDDIVDKELLESIRDKISAVKIDGLPLADKQLEEATVKRGWNPYPLVRYSERPDVVASHLLEGNVAVFVDTSPSVMILPTSFFDLVQHAEENRQTPFIGTYLRWLRFLGILASLFLVPIWLLFALNPSMLPPALSFIGPAKLSKIPLALQFLLAEAGIDLMRMAAIHTPTPLALAISLVSAILVGDIAVQTGLFVNEVILYMAVAAVGMFATPSYELSLANRIVRLMLICLVALFHVPGLVIGWTAVFVILVMQRSFNRPYMWPLIPFDARGMMNVLLRMPVLENRKRPNLLRPQQRDKMPEHGGG